MLVLFAKKISEKYFWWLLNLSGPTTVVVKSTGSNVNNFSVSHHMSFCPISPQNELNFVVALSTWWNAWRTRWNVENKLLQWTSNIDIKLTNQTVFQSLWVLVLSHSTTSRSSDENVFLFRKNSMLRAIWLILSK